MIDCLILVIKLTEWIPHQAIRGLRLERNDILLYCHDCIAARFPFVLSIHSNYSMIIYDMTCYVIICYDMNLLFLNNKFEVKFECETQTITQNVRSIWNERGTDDQHDDECVNPMMCRLRVSFL